MTNRQIYQLIEVGNSLKLIAQSYTELASLKLKSIRSRVEKNRQFYRELTEVYALINKIAVLKKISIPPKPKKTISLLLTSNYRFYGNINNELVKYFIVENTKIRGDKLVVGKTGRDYLKGMNYFHPFEVELFKNDLPNDSELKDLTLKLQLYQQVLVFYPEFESVMVQKPKIRDITQTQFNTLEDQMKNKNLDISLIFGKSGKQQQSFIFEPEILKMLNFFDSQVKILLLEEILLESELSRTASRLIAMDQAQNKANDFIKSNKRLLAQFKRSSYNSRVLETVAGLFQLKQKQPN